jgi:hypothetical protein
MNEFRRPRTSAFRSALSIALLCVFTLACASGKVALVPAEPADRTASLQRDLDELTAGAAPDEARLIAETAIAESGRLAANYRMTRPALFNNILINIGLKKRGLCWHWTEDLLAALQDLSLPNYRLHWGVAHRGKLFREHNSLVVTARDGAFASGIVLDPWRGSGALHWVAVREDRYPWEAR